MRKSIKTFSYILIITLMTWIAIFVAEISINMSRFSAADRPPGALTDEEEKNAFYFYIYWLSLFQIMLLLAFRYLGKTKIHPLVLYGVPVGAIGIFTIIMFRIAFLDMS